MEILVLKVYGVNRDSKVTPVLQGSRVFKENGVRKVIAVV
jgi:hypothetical protein